MARRRFQRGTVFLSGKRNPAWVGRWREDVLDQNGQRRRVCRQQVLGYKQDFPTKKLAMRELEARLDTVNSVNYRALRVATFAHFAGLWEKNVLTQHKRSTQSTALSHLRKWLLPNFGNVLLKDIHGQAIQLFVNALPRSPKTKKNIAITLRMMWATAKAWGYVDHDPFEGVLLPKIGKQKRTYFTEDEIVRIIQAAGEPWKTFYWLAAETGMRSGELCALSLEDVDLDQCAVTVRHSVWRGNRKVLQTPKTSNGDRTLAISSRLALHLRVYLSTWRPNPMRLFFSSRRGTPLDSNTLVIRKLHPLLASLGIKKGGMHAFRHTNGSLMDGLHAPMKLRQERLGHAPGSDITMTVYTHTIGDDDRRIAELLGEKLRRNAPKSVSLTETGVTHVLQYH